MKDTLSRPFLWAIGWLADKLYGGIITDIDWSDEDVI